MLEDTLQNPHARALRLRRFQPLSASDLVQAAGLDSTNLPAWSGSDPHDTNRGRGDLDARLGLGKKGFYHCYLSLFLVDIEGFPLGPVEAPLNVNEMQLVEALLIANSQLKSQGVFEFLESLKIDHINASRRLKGRENPPDVLTVKARIDVEGPE